MSTCSPYKEKCCSLISELINKSKDIIVENEDVLDYDAVELTVLLKSIGFRLNSLDFDCSPTDNSQDIVIEIKCQRSGINSKLSMKSKKCTCPSRKSINNNSFWEVQGISPSTPIARAQGIVQDTSCNLLPDITKKTSNLARTMLTVLLQHYQIDFFEPKNEKINTVVDVKQLMDRVQGRLSESFNENQKIKKEDIERTVNPNFASPGNNIFNSERNAHCSTPLSSINRTAVPLYDIPKITLDVTNGNENNQESLIENEKPPEECIVKSPKNEILATTPTETEISFDKITPDTERDICLIQSITDARKQLDTALLMLKCNITRTLSQSSFANVTPQIATSSTKKSPVLKKEKIPLSIINPRLSVGPIDAVNRRHSTGARLENKSLIMPNRSLLKNATSSVSVNDIKKKAFGLSVNSTFLKPDTPRPRVTSFTGKKPPEKVVSNSKIFTKRTPTGTNLKSTTAITPKVPSVTKTSKLPSLSTSKKL